MNLDPETYKGILYYHAGQFSQAISALLPRAEASDSSAEYHLGSISNSCAVPDIVGGILYFQSACEKLHPAALYELACRHLNCAENNEADIKATKWMWNRASQLFHLSVESAKAASLNDDEEAITFLGWLHCEGFGVLPVECGIAHDPSRTESLLTTAASNGYLPAAKLLSYQMKQYNSPRWKYWDNQFRAGCSMLLNIDCDQ